MSTFVALLRGINVGGKNKLPMKDLVAMFVRVGCVNVRHYIQSGNIVFDAPPKIAARIPTLVGAEIERELGLRAPLLVRTHDELRAVSLGNPLLKAGVALCSLYVMFLQGSSRGAQNYESVALDPQRSPPDTFVVKGREIYLSLPNGAGRSKLTNAYFDAKLGTVSTARNWNTVLKLVGMSAA